MGVHSGADLLRHVGHTIECVTYGPHGSPANVAVECEDCCEVIIDFDVPPANSVSLTDAQLAVVREACEEILLRWRADAEEDDDGLEQLESAALKLRADTNVGMGPREG